MKKKLAFFLTLALGFMFLSSGARAASQATMTLANVSGDNVQVTVTGDASNTIRLSFLPSGASSVTTIVFGTTDSNGNFSTSISSGAYGIPQGSPAYVTVNGMQSATALWPAYSSSLTLSKTGISIAVGQSITVTGSSALILPANGISSYVSASITGSQITITGLNSGSGTLYLCGANVGCSSLSVTVGGENIDESAVSFSDNNFTVYGSQRKEISIYGGAEDGYAITSNSNPNAVDASVRSKGDIIVIYAGTIAGTAKIVVCSKNMTTNCANLNVTSFGDSVAELLSFSPSEVTLSPGLTQNVIVSGESDNNYYISSNSNTGSVTSTISGNVLKLVGGNNAGTSVISVCSTTVSGACSSLTVTLSLNSSSASDTTLSFSQNVVSVPKNATTNVTVAGGTGNGYVISSNSNPSAATANITGNTNIINISGIEVGSSIIMVCASGAGSVCASIYVSVGPEQAAIYFSQNNIALSSGEKKIITISGGSSEGKVISSNSNSAAVLATINSDGTVLVLTGGTVSGTAAINVCSEDYDTNCAVLTASNTVSNSDSDSNSNSNSNSNDNPASSAQDLIQKILGEATDLVNENGLTRDTALETKTTASYTNSLVSGKNITANAKQLMTDFIAYGTATTKVIGAGERAGVLGSYQKAFNKLPSTESEWADVIKIANGRWPGETSASALDSAKVEFKKVYQREANLDNQNDYAAVSIIAYGLRPAARNLGSEAFAINVFYSVYGHNPVSSLAWDIVRAIAYSGATR